MAHGVHWVVYRLQISGQPPAPRAPLRERSEAGRGWIPALDGLRGLAILMVVVYHCRHASVTPRGIAALFEIGWTGVDLFFVLSGFLITGILLDSRGAANYFSSFYARRILRIFPVYYLALAAVLLAGTLGVTASAHYDGTPAWYFIYAQNWIFVNIPFLGHFWSLAVEEQFYLLWPLVVYRFPARRTLQIAVTAAALAIPLRSALVFLQVDPNYVYWNTFARMDALLIGAACACLLKLGRWTDALARHAKWLWCVPLLALPLLRLLLKGFRVGPPMQRFGYTAVALVYACLLLTLVLDRERGSPVQSFFASRIMRVFGRYSYGAYIWHPMVIAGIAAFEKKTLHGTPPWFLNVPLLVAAALAAGMCSYFAVERPLLSLKRHFEAR